MKHRPAQFLEHASSKFSGEGFQAHVLDIEGCYPNMPKDKIEHAMLQLVQEARREGHTGVSVPMRAKKLQCSWKEVGGGFKWIPFDVMLGMLDFSLNNAIVRLKDGRLVRQLKGIPMGDALSPGMTIGTCGWMEREWMNTLDEHTKKKFRAKRYMDDILLMLNKQGWDYERFYKDFKESHCYMYPLKLEEATEGTFLETSFEIMQGELNFRLKNANAGTNGKTIWRYQSYESYTPATQKASVLTATLKKVDYMASDQSEKFESAMDKLHEFRELRYPARVRRNACAVLAKERDSVVWNLAGTLQR